MFLRSVFLTFSWRFFIHSPFISEILNALKEFKTLYPQLEFSWSTTNSWGVYVFEVSVIFVFIKSWDEAQLVCILNCKNISNTMRKIIAYFKDLLYINFDGSLKFFLWGSYSVIKSHLWETFLVLCTHSVPVKVWF